jgi:glycosyltransferase involved in cell wall biosynthesis
MAVDDYFKRFGFCERQIQTPPHSDLGLVVVIPCFNEPDLLASLESLWACGRPGCATEVIVVVNSPSGCSPDILAQNQTTLAQTAKWISSHADPQLAFHLLHFPELGRKQAGVGLARKIGMDEASRRFGDVGKPGGVIACFDADCACDRNYLMALERHFQRHPRSPGCSIYFEHPLAGPLDPKVYEALAAYELHLRYYVEALRWAAFPHAYHTIGSAMAVRAGAYQKQGGMNKRQAGEDFYFLQKIIPLGNFTELTDTRVIPSPRPSDRVPFGTGKAVRSYLDDSKLRTYPLRAFTDLRDFFSRLRAIHRGNAWQDGLPETMRSFLAADEFDAALEQIRGNASSEEAFRKRFFNRFDAFTVMKFIHHARDRTYGDADVQEEAAKLLKQLQPAGSVSRNLAELLGLYRVRDRQPWSPGSGP